MANPNSSSIPRPERGDVVELILEDHRLFESVLRELRNEQNDRDALRQQMAELLVAHGEAEESQVYPQLERKDAIDEEEAEHGKKEHDEGYETLLPLLEATELYDEDFSQNLHEFSETCCTTSTRRSATSSTPRVRTSRRTIVRGWVRPGWASATGCSTRAAAAWSRCARSSTALEVLVNHPRRHAATAQPALPAALDRQHRHRRRCPADRGRGPGADLHDHRLLGVRRADRCLRTRPARRLRALGRGARRRHRPAHPADLHDDRADRPPARCSGCRRGAGPPTCGCCSGCSRCSRRSSRSTSRPGAPYCLGCCRSTCCRPPTR